MGERLPGSAKIGFARLLAKTPRILPHPRLLAKGPTPFTPIPISRLTDAEEYTGANPDLTAALEAGTDSQGAPAWFAPVGLAEYTNANFASRDTFFTEAFDPAHRWWSPYPRRASTNLAELGLPETILAEDGLADRTIYVRKDRDGESIAHFAKATYAATVIREQTGRAVETLALGFQLDDRIFEDYVHFLLPRAVGYSAALLDYFFRGKLEASLTEEPTGPGTLALQVTNLSEEPLGPGTLTVYSEATNGLRQPLPGAVLNLDSPIAPQGELPRLTFPAPAEAVRYVLVYQGSLGQEVKDASRNFPGAVIGKALGGVRVEEIFADYGGSDPTQWHWTLRTPTGLFRLPLSLAEFPMVTWGDTEHSLVAQTPSGPDAPNRVQAYTLARQPGSGEPVLAESAAGPVVKLTPLTEATLPADLPLGTTLEFTHTINYRQQKVTYDYTHVLQWYPQPPYGPEDGGYREPTNGQDYTGNIQIDRFVAEALPFTARLPLVLDRAHCQAWTADSLSYRWWIGDVGLTAARHLVALVGVSLLPPTPEAQVTLPFYGLNESGNRVVISTVTVTPSLYGPDPLLWALLDLTTGTVLASTAEATLALSSQQDVEAPDWSSGILPGYGPPVYVHRFERYTGGGPKNGLRVPVGWEKDVAVRPDVTDPPPVYAADLIMQEGRGASAAGLLRPELLGPLTAAGLFQVAPAWRSPVTEMTFYRAGDLGLRVARESPSTTAVVPLVSALRARPAPGAERVVFRTGVTGVNGHDVDTILSWAPATAQARVLAQLLSADDWPNSLRDVTGSTVLVGSELMGQAVLLPLTGEAPPRILPDPDALYSFTLLDPQYLYNTETMRFYAPQVPLQPSLFPAPLAAVPDDPYGSSRWGDYHVVRMP